MMEEFRYMALAGMSGVLAVCSFLIALHLLSFDQWQFWVSAGCGVLSLVLAVYWLVLEWRRCA